MFTDFFEILGCFIPVASMDAGSTFGDILILEYLEQFFFFWPGNSNHSFAPTDFKDTDLGGHHEP